MFTDQDRVAVATCEDGCIRRIDVETGSFLQEEQVHTAEITDLQAAPDGTHALSSSKDKSAKLIDLATLEVIRTYKHLKPVNSAAMSPLNHVRFALQRAASLFSS